MLDFLLGTHEFLGNHSFPEFIVGYLFGAALIIGAPTNINSQYFCTIRNINS